MTQIEIEACKPFMTYSSDEEYAEAYSELENKSLDGWGDKNASSVVEVKFWCNNKTVDEILDYIEGAKAYIEWKH